MNSPVSFLSSLRCGGLSACALAAAFAGELLVGGLQPVHAATSSIVGFYNIAVPAGNSAWVCGLVTDVEYEGVAATVSADVDGKALLQFSAPGWTVNGFNLHYAEPQSGTCAGLAVDVLSNTADTLKLNTTPAAAGLTSGMTFIVRRHSTLGGLLPDGGGFMPFADTISLFGSTGLQTTYFYSSISSSWITVLGADATDAVIRPGQGFVVQASSPLTVIFGKGAVSHLKTTPVKIGVYANVPNIIGAINPLGNTSSTLGALGVAASMQAFNDSLVTLTPGSLAQAATYLSTGSGLIDSGTGNSGDGASVPTGTGVVINVNAAKNVQLAPVSVIP